MKKQIVLLDRFYLSIGLYYVKAPHCAPTSCLFCTLPCEKQSFEKLDR